MTNLKKVLGIGAFLIASTVSYSISGNFGMGIERDSFNETDGYATRENATYGYVSTSLRDIIPGKPLTLDLRYQYRYMDKRDFRNQDRRNRYEAFLGYQWKWDRLTFSPKIGIRHDAFSHGESKDTQGRVNEYQSVYRFYPNFSYKINDNLSYYFSGFVAPTRTKMSDEVNRKNDEDGYGKTYSDYKHELETGLEFKLAPGRTLKTGLYSEYERLVEDQSKEEWQFRVMYTHKLNEKWTFTPYARIGLDREQREKKNGEARDILRHRFALRTRYQMTETFAILGEVYWQTERQHQYSKPAKHNKEFTYFNLGFVQAF